MKQSKSHLPLALAGVVASAILIALALLFNQRFPDALGGLVFGLAGALFGVSGAAIAMELISRRYTPEQRQEMERGERDERNVAIREKAAQSSWYWSLGLLWIVFLVSLVLHQGIFIALASGVIVLHCVFYLINMHRWAKRI